MSVPRIIAETGDFAAAWKPPRMHCAPLKTGGGGTLLEWYAAIFPPVLGLAGRKTGEGGLVHRLDFETRGLVLFAKNQRALDFFLDRQAAGELVKEYGAVCQKNDISRRLPGFPPPPSMPAFRPEEPFVIESFFRPFGPGRKQVRPVSAGGRGYKKTATDRGACYRTEIVNVSGAGAYYECTVRIRRGFRHQIRCHLAWAGFPIVNDPVYGAPAEPEAPDGFLALSSRVLFFPDPRTGETREYHCW